MNKIIFSAILLSFIFLACQKNAITGRRSLSLIPESELIGMSLIEYDKFLNEHAPLSSLDKNTILVKSVGLKIQHAV